MTTPTNTGDPRWTAITEQIAAITNPNHRDIAADCLMEAYLLGVETGFKRAAVDPQTGQPQDPTRGTGSTQEPEQADQAAPDTPDPQDPTQALTANFADTWLTAEDDTERTDALGDLLEGWYDAWPDTAVTSSHWPIAEALVRMLGPWDKADNNTSQPSKITDTATVAEGIGSPRRAGSARVVPYAERQPLYAAYQAAHTEAERIGGTLSDDSIVQAAVKAYAAAQPDLIDVEDLASLRRKAAMLSPVLLWRDHTAAALDTFIKAVEGVLARVAHSELAAAVKAARAVLTADPEKAYADQGFDTAVSHKVTDLRTIHRLRHDLESAEQNYQREAANAEQLRQHFDRASREAGQLRHELAILGDHTDNLTALHAEATKERDQARDERDQLRQSLDSSRDEVQRVAKEALRRGRRIATLTSEQPTDAEYGAATAAIIGSWPHMAVAGGVFAERVAISAVDAAWKLNGAPRAEDTEPARPRRYDRCDDTCTIDCGHCKGQGRPGGKMLGTVRIAFDPAARALIDRVVRNNLGER